MVIQGLEGLKKVSNLHVLIPSAVTIARILKAVGEKNAELDQEAAKELRELFIKTGEMSGISFKKPYPEEEVSFLFINSLNSSLFCFKYSASISFPGCVLS